MLDYSEEQKNKPCPRVDCRPQTKCCSCGLNYIQIPAALGDDSEGSEYAPENGAYVNKIVEYEVNGHVYIYGSDGIPVSVAVNIDKLNELIQEYLDSIDLQEEVNNKLDQMVEDGTLSDLIRQIITPADQTLHFKTSFVKSTYLQSNPAENGMQGGCVLPDNSIIQFTGHDKVLHYSQNGDLLNSNTLENFGHCNGCCYNTKIGKVVVVGPSNTFFVVNPETLTLENTITPSSENYPLYAFGIVYLADTDEYILTGWWGDNRTRSIWKVNSDFELVLSVETNFDDINSTSNIGRIGNYVAINNTYTHQLLLFNPTNLNFVKVVKIDDVVSDTWVITEEEWFDTRSDGKIVLGFIAGQSANPHTGTGTYIYAICDPTRNYEACPIKDTYSPKNEFYYVDHTNTSNNRNGTGASPFNNIYEALNSSLRTKNVTGNVTIRFNNNSTVLFAPLFMMNKSYTIWNPNRSIDFLSSISINKGCSVSTNRPVILQIQNEKPEYFGHEPSDIICEGDLIFTANYISTNDESKIIISGDGSFTGGFSNCGFNINYFNGIINSRDNRSSSLSNILINNNSVYNSNYLYRQIKGLKCSISAENGVYKLPTLSTSLIAVIRVQITGETTAVTEPSVVWSPNTYVSLRVLDSENNMVAIVIAADGTISATSNDGTATVNRVKVITI